MRFRSCLLFLIIARLALVANPSLAVPMTVDASQRFQVIDGLGSNLNVDGWDNGQLRPAIDLLVDQNGTSLFRVIRDPMTWVSSDSLIPALHDLDPATLAQVYETPAMEDIWGTIGYLNEKGIRGEQIVLTFMGWTPVWMGGSGQFGSVSRIDSGREDEFATMIASLVYYGREVKNLDFTLLSPLNEQDWDGLEGPNVEPGQYRVLLEALIAELDDMGQTEVRIVGPDAAGAPSGYVQEILDSPILSGRIDHLAYHQYGSPGMPGDDHEGKNYWMTETAPPCGGCDVNGPPSEGEWEFATQSGDLLLQDLANGFAAVMLYEAYDGFYYHHNSYSTWGLLSFNGTSYAARKRFYVNAQINRFIRPGATRIAVDVGAGVFGPVVAFMDEETQSITIVGQSISPTSVTVQGRLSNLPFTVPRLRNSRTTQFANLQQGNDVLVNGETFSAIVPGRSFFSLQWVGNTKPTASILAPSDGEFFHSGSTIELSGTGTDTQTPASELTYHWMVDLVSNAGVQPWATFEGPTASYVAPALQGPGAHQRIRMTSQDPEGLVSDTAVVRLWPEIDLELSALGFSPNPPIAGQTAYCTFKLWNSGRMAAPMSHWVVRHGEATLAYGDIAISAMSHVDMVMQVVFPTTGSALLRVTADSLATVVETDETDNTLMQTVTVSVVPGNHAPEAVVSATPATGQAPLLVEFFGGASSDVDGDSLMYDWSFGDGRVAAGRRPSHTYAKAGVFVAVMAVNDGRGSIDTASVEIQVVDFPRTPVLDDFNRADGQLMSPWVDGNADFSVVGGSLAPGTGDAFTQWDGAAFGPNQEAYTTLSIVDLNGLEKNLMLKTQGTSWSTGHVQVSYNVQQARVVFVTYAPPSTWTEVGSVAGVTFVAGDQFGARALANGELQAYRNGVEIGSASIAQWPFVSMGGRIGLSVAGSPAARFDDFGGGTIEPESSPLAVPVLGSTSVQLSSAHPNPTRRGAVWTLSLPVAANVDFSVLDLQGREVWSQPAREHRAGQWPLLWEGGDVPTGLYFARVRVGSETFLRRVAVLR